MPFFLYKTAETPPVRILQTALREREGIRNAVAEWPKRGADAGEREDE